MAERKLDDPPLRPTGEFIVASNLFLPLNTSGHMERWNILRNNVKFYNDIQVTATYSVPRALLQHFGNDRIEGLIYAALIETLKHQPIMGVTIEDEGTKEPKWRRLSTINLREVVKVINADPNANPDKWVQDTHRAPMPQIGELPLWKVIIAFQDSALLGNERHVPFAVGFFAHHAIADGISLGSFHLTFLEALNALIASPGSAPSNSNEAATITVPKLPLVPNLEMKATLSVSILFVVIQLFKAFFYDPIDPLNWAGPLVNAEHPRPPIASNRSFSLSSPLVSKLAAKCRTEKTTITALVTVLTARKLATMYPEYKRFTGTIPFSLRKFTGHSPKDMGVYVSRVTPYFSSEANPPRGYISCVSSLDGKLHLGNDKELWESARTLKKFISESTSTIHNQMVNMVKFVSDIRKYFLVMLGTKRQSAFEVTNIGVIDGGVGSDEEMASFDRLMFSGGGSTYGEPYAVFLATAKHGYMTVSIVWQDVVVSDEGAKDMLGFLEESLRELAEE
jgi:hypothetical protein